MIFSLETSTTPQPTTWTQPTATRRTTPKKLQPVSKRSPTKRGVSLWMKIDANLSCRQLTFTRTWGGSLLQQNIMRQLQESLSPRWTLEPIWIKFCFVFRCFSILNPDLNQLFQCADLDKAMQHYEQVAEKFRNPSSNQIPLLSMQVNETFSYLLTPGSGLFQGGRVQQFRQQVYAQGFLCVFVHRLSWNNRLQQVGILHLCSSAVHNIAK